MQLCLAGTWLFAHAGVAAERSAEVRDWRDEILYFVMIDRFDDGDPRNNDQGRGEFDPRDERKFNGGDLAGIERRLGYIRGLGATALWITPPVANQWWNDKAQYGGYHGYWASDFRSVDAHFGTLAGYRRLADAMHGRDLRLVQDIVVNHTADYFGWRDEYDAAHPERGVDLRRQYDGATAPTQPPFDRNDPRDPAQRAAGIYHWTPGIRDFNDPVQEHDWQLADLDDMNTEHPEVRRALRDSYGFWIREIGVDGFRVDTAFYVPPAFFDDFLRADDPQAPGVLAVARAQGRSDFHVFGEGFGLDKPYRETMARKIDGYMRDTDGRPLLPGMLNFPLYGTLGDVFARGHPAAELGHRIESMMRVHADPWRMPTFVDNHDVDRFLADGDEAGLRQALLAIMTLPGIPTIYAGTEQGLRGQREPMFAAARTDGRDRFDTRAALYRDIAAMTALRRTHRVFSRGTPTVLAGNAAAPGAIAWRMSLRASEADPSADPPQDHHALVVFNSAAHPVLLDDLDTGLPGHTRLRPGHALASPRRPLTLDAQGRATLVLPPRSAQVWLVDLPSIGSTQADNDTPSTAAPSTAATTAGKAKTPKAAERTARPQIDPLPETLDGDVLARGRARPGATLRLVVDGDLAGARRVRVDRDGHWRQPIDTGDMIDPALMHRVVAWDPATNAVSTARAFRVTRAWERVAAVEDPVGDDHGPEGHHVYPLDAGWRETRPADLLGAELWRSGGALRLRLRMRGTIASWNPPNGFDHVAFTVYFSTPGRDGVRVMPLQSTTLPGDRRWQQRLRANGWSNVVTGTDGADAGHEGRPLGAAARIEVDHAAHTVTFTLPARAFGPDGAPPDLGIHVTTWDYDGGYRAIAPEPSGFTFGGGPADAAKVMDGLWLEARRTP